MELSRHAGYSRISHWFAVRALDSKRGSDALA